MRRIAASVVILVGVLMAGCSRADRFEVVNATNLPLELRYRFKPLRSSDAGAVTQFRFEEPSLARTTTPSSSDFSRLSASTGGYTRDEATGTVTLVVPPGCSVALATIVNYFEENSGAAEKFPIDGIEVRGDGIELRLDGDHARRAFRAQDNRHVLWIA
jgi:hypothetical protein